ncbi:sensor histidine kinase [Pontibacter sp. SGAir0037]|uniref:sensor histidine kinase n=1 Tax=Pontibacter sp. SGAir0037 TaxID=2571030 RepID=UPI0010F7C768|nr:histidine kinase [Pontibacter sp. SGAir0037]
MTKQQNNYIKDLLIVAIITSLFFGVFSVIHLLITSQFSFMERPHLPPPGDMPPGFRPRLPDQRVHMSLGFNILVNTLMMLTFWVMNIWLYTRFQKLKLQEKTRHIIRYAVSYVCMFILIILYFTILGQVSLDPRYGRALFFPFIAGITNNTIVLIILDLVILNRNKSQIELENTQLKMNSIQAQHQHLKHQLQPHFLFNSLNTLKSLIRRDAREAEDYLLRLSEFLRASLTSDSQDTVPLRDELKLCIDYLEMQKVRFKDAFKYRIDVPKEQMESAYLPVFALQLLVENAIKHNGFTEEEPLTICIRYVKDDCLVVTNNKKTKPVHEPFSGIGLRNLSERYNVLFGKGINILETEESFIVQLPILHK